MTKLITTLCCLAAIAVGFVPSHVAVWARSVVRDMFEPGVHIVSVARHATSTQIRQRFLGANEQELAEQLEALQTELADTQRSLRRERLAHRRTSETKLLALQQHDDNHKPIDPPPLIVPQVVQANVLGEELASTWRAGKLLDSGRNNGLVEAALVLESSAALLDQGENAGLAPDLPVFAGRCVIGKLQHVGRWTSTWVPITDKRFRGRARLARVTSDGLIFGAEGVLVGTGKEACRLTFIKATEPVLEGDEVFALETPGGFETPLLYGTVTRADVGPSETHWQIDVRPAADARLSKSVCVVRPQMNLKRLAN